MLLVNLVLLSVKRLKMLDAKHVQSGFIKAELQVLHALPVPKEKRVVLLAKHRTHAKIVVKENIWIKLDKPIVSNFWIYFFPHHCNPYIILFFLNISQAKIAVLENLEKQKNKRPTHAHHAQ